jgi:NAD(P)-dependent dehydrogenase (short-subunit alcohol dehydrogenase family)
MFELTGQTALVTGAATGIGEAIAQRLTAAGARVAVADIDLDEANAAAKRIGGGAFAVCLDVTRTEHAMAAIEKVIATAGSLEILVNNAGLAGRAAPIWEQTDEDWHQVMSVNIHGPFYLCRAVLPKMRQPKHGCLLCIEGRDHRTHQVHRQGSRD